MGNSYFFIHNLGRDPKLTEMITQVLTKYLKLNIEKNQKMSMFFWGLH